MCLTLKKLHAGESVNLNLMRKMGTAFQAFPNLTLKKV